MPTRLSVLLLLPSCPSSTCLHLIADEMAGLVEIKAAANLGLQVRSYNSAISALKLQIENDKMLNAFR